ncbi:unnamed protein product [Notodromas monacha]|uniref:Uncharacterized protein n=1 Tax=Notodromas monacha TaxID=399045 RepID=A0A7R9GA35_9CRUS|nr:unnamed protein product [Notodromas monacha]CAG0913276.1 unnamed protein product [Notodromas monacha]
MLHQYHDGYQAVSLQGTQEFWMPSQATQMCCTADSKCTDHMNMGEKIERFEDKAACEILSVDAARVGGQGILGQCVVKEATPRQNGLRTAPAAGRLLNSLRAHHHQHRDESRRDASPAPRTTLAVRIPAHRGDQQQCQMSLLQDEVRPSDCIGPDCRCAPTTVQREHCGYAHEGPCNCANQLSRQTGLETALSFPRYDVEGNRVCTCEENHGVVNLPDRPEAAYIGAACPHCALPRLVERPRRDPAIQQQIYTRFEDRLSRVPPPSCPCSLVKPVVMKEAPRTTPDFVGKWAMYETGIAFQTQADVRYDHECEAVEY